MTSTTATTTTDAAGPTNPHTALAAAVEAFDVLTAPHAHQFAGRPPEDDYQAAADAVTTTARAAGVWSELVDGWEAKAGRLMGPAEGDLQDALSALLVPLPHAAAEKATAAAAAARQAVQVTTMAITAATTARDFAALPQLRQRLELDEAHALEQADLDVLTYRAQVAERLGDASKARQTAMRARSDQLTQEAKELEAQAKDLRRRAGDWHTLTNRLDRVNEHYKGARAARELVKARTAAAPTKAQREAAYAARVA